MHTAPAAAASVVQSCGGARPIPTDTYSILALILVGRNFIGGEAHGDTDAGAGTVDHLIRTSLGCLLGVGGAAIDWL